MKPIIFGISKDEITKEEAIFFKKHKPLGYIIFSRNIKNKKQLQELNSTLREINNFPYTLISVDQEGGRVARLKPPIWNKYEPAEYFYNLYKQNKQNALNAVYENAVNIASELKEVGFNVDYAPVADIRYQETHDVIGNRAFGFDVESVSDLAKKMAEGLQSAGIMPVLKHIPGHGRSKVDSHSSLPIVDVDLKELESSDFHVFKNLKDSAHLAMTAHIVYSKIDPDNPATLSPIIIRDIIRGKIGFTGLLMTDDISMKALKGSLADIAKRSLASGCDIILHCNGNMNEMKEIAENINFASDDLLEKICLLN